MKRFKSWLKSKFKRLTCKHSWYPIMGSSKINGVPFVRSLVCNRCNKRIHGIRRIRRYVNRVNKIEKVPKRYRKDRLI